MIITIFMISMLLKLLPQNLCLPAVGQRRSMTIDSCRPILLFRNLNQSIGLCNDTRLIVKRLGQRVIEVKIITRNNVNKRVFIPRIIMSPSGTDWPFVLCHRQFPIRVAFAITINKSQG